MWTNFNIVDLWINRFLELIAVILGLFGIAW